MLWLTPRTTHIRTAGCIQISEATFELLGRPAALFSPTGGIEVKGKGRCGRWTVECGRLLQAGRGHHAVHTLLRRGRGRARPGGGQGTA